MPHNTDILQAKVETKDISYTRFIHSMSDLTSLFQRTTKSRISHLQKNTASASHTDSWEWGRSLLEDKRVHQPSVRRHEVNILLKKVLRCKNTQCLLCSICRDQKCKRTEVFHSANFTTVTSNSKISVFQLTTLWLNILWNDTKQHSFSTRCLNTSGSLKKISSFSISIINNAQKELKVMKLILGFLGVFF